LPYRRLRTKEMIMEVASKKGKRMRKDESTRGLAPEHLVRGEETLTRGVHLIACG